MGQILASARAVGNRPGNGPATQRQIIDLK
jgi:hypothetical protein